MIAKSPVAEIMTIDQGANEMDTTRQKYFTLLNDSERVHELVAQYVQPYSHIIGMTNLPKARQGKGIMRALLTKLVHEAVGGREDTGIACAIQEISNIYEYLFNAILDNKNSIRTNTEAVDQNIICASLFREIMEKMIMDLDCSTDQKLLILKLAAEAMTQCSIGQSNDLELNIEKLEEFDALDNYVTYYIEKSRLQSGCLYGFSAQIGAILANATNKQIELARLIGEAIGTGMHITNDFGDFAIIGDGTGFKCYQDQFSDLRNGRLSLPVFYVLKYGTQDQKELFTRIASGAECTQADLQNASRAIVDSGALRYGQSLFCSLERKAKRIIHRLPQSEHRNMLSVMTTINRSNKYLYALRHHPIA